MRHLYLSVRGSTSFVFQSSHELRTTAVFAALAAIIAAGAIPLGAQQTARAKSPPPAAAATPTVPAPSNDSYNVTVPSVLRDAPLSAAVGVLQKNANVEVVARDRGWTRVRIEGWVPDSVQIGRASCRETV